MVEEMKIKLENLGPIKQANINFSKITVVGGHNATGKSSLSKFLFSYLKANSFNRQEIAYDSFLKHAKTTANLLSSHLRKNGVNDKEVLSNFSSSKFNRRRYKSIFDLIDAWSDMVDIFNDLDEFEDDEYIGDYIGDVGYSAFVIKDNSRELYNDLANTLLNSEFSDIKLNANAFISNDLDKVLEKFDDGTINDFVKDKDNFRDCFFVSMFSHKSNNFLNYGGIVLDDVFYIDSVSILDVFSDSTYFDANNPNHIGFLRKCLLNNSKNANDMFDSKINKNIIDLEEDINKIVNGQFVYEKGEFNFVSANDIKSPIHNTASGIKQLGIIQLLLANRSLKENCVLIIDEPEVNLHPEWQMKLAEILVLISKKLNVSIYINTHSPLFIEAIYTFADYYDISDKTKYHLAERCEDGLVNIDEVEMDNLSKIYDNLGKPYLAMDVLRIQKTLD